MKIEAHKMPFILIARCLVCSAPVVEETVMSLKEDTIRLMVVACDEHDTKALESVIKTAQMLVKK